jgi:hypothetical protein
LTGTRTVKKNRLHRSEKRAVQVMSIERKSNNGK